MYLKLGLHGNCKYTYYDVHLDIRCRNILQFMMENLSVERYYQEANFFCDRRQNVLVT